MKNIRLYQLTIIISTVLTFFLVPEGKTYADNRLSGENRYETAAKVSKEGWLESEYVVLAQGTNFPDALSGVPLAYKLDAPILLTHPSRLPFETSQEMKRLKASKVIILGGPSAISPNVETQLKSELGMQTRRIEGKNRYETAERIAEEFGLYSRAVLVNGLNYPDALSIAPYAAKNGYPVLLTRGDGLTERTRELLGRADDVLVIGGTSVIQPSALSGLNIRRIGGANRFETTANILNQLDTGTGYLFLSTGLNFPDALTSSVLAAKRNGSIVLTRQSSIPDPIGRILQEIPIVNVTTIGGEKSLSEEVVLNIMEIPAYEKAAVPTNKVIYYVPHPDDEILSYGVGMTNDLVYGHDVHVVLLTHGKSSTVYQRLLRQYPDLTREEFGEARVLEFLDAMERIGVPESNIHLYDLPDSGIAREEVKEIVLEMEAQFPGASHKGFSFYDTNPDHVHVGLAINDLYFEGEIERALFFISLHHFQTTNGMNLPVLSREAVLHAARAYMVFLPDQNRFAIGYNSVPRWFDQVIQRPRNKVHGPEVYEESELQLKWHFKPNDPSSH